jgi:hypothetical protein
MPMEAIALSARHMDRREFVRAAGVGAAAILSAKPGAGQDVAPRAPVMADEDQAVAAIVEKHTGHVATSVEELTWFDVYGDATAQYYSVRCQEREYIVRVPPPNPADEYRAVIGKYVLDELRARGLMAPLVCAIDRDCDNLGGPVAVTTRIPGRPWRHYEELWFQKPDLPMPATGAEVGRYVRGLHDIPAAGGFGPLDDEGVGLTESWTEACWSRDTKWAEAALARQNLSPEEFALVAAVIDERAPECDIPEGSVLWMDDIMFGMMVDSRKRTVTGVCHAASAASGDPDYELEWFAYYYEDTHSLIVPPDEFADGYGRAYNEKSDRRSFYRMSCYLCKLSWLPADSERALDHRRKLLGIAHRLS